MLNEEVEMKSGSAVRSTVADGSPRAAASSSVEYRQRQKLDVHDCPHLNHRPVFAY